MIHANQLIEESGGEKYLLGDGDNGGVVRINVKLSKDRRFWIATSAIESYIDENENERDINVRIDGAVINLSSPVKSKIKNEEMFSVALYRNRQVSTVRPLIWKDADGNYKGLTIKEKE